MMTAVEKVTAKAVIPAAGLGQRLRPITKVLPKEMFPIGSHPVIEWVIAEAVTSGCTEVAVVISPHKRIIEEYLTTCCPGLTNRCRLTFLMQPEPLGLGHALVLTRGFCDGHPCAVLLPDVLIDGPQLPLLQMNPVFKDVGRAVIGIAEVPAENASRYGRLQVRQVGSRISRVEAFLPRTTTAKAPSMLVCVGRYLFSPECLDYAAMLLDQPRTGEFDDGMILQYMLDIREPVHGVHIAGRLYDISTPHGYTTAWQCFGRRKPSCTGASLPSQS